MNNTPQSEISQELQERIDDYILGLLDDNSRAEIEALMNNNAELQNYHNEQKAFIELSQADEVPDPGTEFWNSFADNVLKKCKPESPIENTTKPDTGVLAKLRYWWSELPLLAKLAEPALALGLLIALTIYLIPEQDHYWQELNLSAIDIQKLENIQHSHFSFTESTSLNVFNLGQQYALSTAYFYKEDLSNSTKKLEAIHNLAGISHLTVSTHNIAATLETTKDQLAKSLSSNDFVLFRSGIWITKVRLLTESRQINLLNTKSIQEEGQVLFQDLRTIDFPKGVHDHWNTINSVLSKKSLEKTDIKQLTTAIETINSILG
ncbi:MAG: hypothetical protein OQL06_05315 [Gammaproteobacteria bacterium]|nr:hypothetical protein [Gammaproteobacteria bacterium]